MSNYTFEGGTVQVVSCGGANPLAAMIARTMLAQDVSGLQVTTAKDVAYQSGGAKPQGPAGGIDI